MTQKNPHEEINHNQSPQEPEFAAAVQRRPGKLRFGAFEVDLDQREIRKRGLRVYLQHKPFLALETLLRNAGTLVTREELSKRLWPDSHVDFERGLNTALNAVRQALGDSSRECRFIETRPGLGYRFIAPVETIRSPDTARPGPVETPERNASEFDAYQDYLKGRYFLNKLTEDDVRKAVAYFESAIAADPDCTLAYAGLADACCRMAAWNVFPAESACRRAKEFALTALSRDSELAETHIALARMKMFFDWDWKSARNECLRALDLRPDHADARDCYADVLSALGDSDEALKQSRRARILDPLSLPVATGLAWRMYLARNFEGAAEHCWRVLTLEPRYPAAQYTLGLAYQQLEMHDEAITEFRNAIACSGDPTAATAAIAHAYAAAGSKDQAVRTLRELETASSRRYISPYWQAIAYSGLGEREMALQCLEQACRTRDAALCWTKVDPRLDPLRTEPRFAAVLRVVGLEPETP